MRRFAKAGLMASSISMTMSPAHSLTPRKVRSKWSQVNRARAEELLTAGRVRPRGLARIEAARADGRWDAAYAPASKAQCRPIFKQHSIRAQRPQPSSQR